MRIERAGQRPAATKSKAKRHLPRQVPPPEEWYDVPRNGPPQKAGPTQRRLGPGVAVFGKREGADALAVDGEDGVANGWEDRR